MYNPKKKSHGLAACTYVERADVNLQQWAASYGDEASFINVLQTSLQTTDLVENDGIVKTVEPEGVLSRVGLVQSY